ncbi:hypothetical protein QF003_002839 [Leclercia adecarboxylata]
MHTLHGSERKISPSVSVNLVTDCANNKFPNSFYGE